VKLRGISVQGIRHALSVLLFEWRMRAWWYKRVLCVFGKHKTRNVSYDFAYKQCPYCRKTFH
jgi:hypothetical protein